MPLPSTPQEFFASKLLVPSELRTSQWGLVPGLLKERIFFSSGVCDMDILTGFHRACTAVLSGSMNYPEATRIIREALAEVGYRPSPGQKRTLKDLSDPDRQLITMRTNVELAQGWAEEALARKAAKAFPAVRLVRGGHADVPRPWAEKIWPDAIAASGSGGRADDMVALLEDPVWLHLSDFGVPYTPLKWGSMMMKRTIGYTETRALGLLQPGQSRRLDPMPHAFDLSPDEVRTAIASHLQGIAEWRGETLVFSEPNGTGVFPLKEMARVLTSPRGELSGSFQLCALWEWRTLGASDEATVEFLRKWAGRSILDDFHRLCARVTATDAGESLSVLLSALVAEIEDIGFS